MCVFCLCEGVEIILHLETMVTGSVPLDSDTTEPPVILYAPEKLCVSLSLLSLSAVCQPAFGTGSELSPF